jgi:hypothetical protein
MRKGLCRCLTCPECGRTLGASDKPRIGISDNRFQVKAFGRIVPAHLPHRGIYAAETKEGPRIRVVFWRPRLYLDGRQMKRVQVELDPKEEQHMNSWRKYTVMGLVVCLMHLSLADVVLSADSVTPNRGLTRQRVDQFGVGAKVKVELTSGKRLKGAIQSVEDAGFLLVSSNAGSPTHVPYGEVAQLNLAKNTYKAEHPISGARLRICSRAFKQALDGSFCCRWLPSHSLHPREFEA